MKSVTVKQEIWFSKKASSRLKSLRPVFKKLHMIHQEYINAQDGTDCPYWYNERPHIGLLATAVWLSGGTALEEYVTEKETGRGRCDLWLGTSKAGFECEAKRFWLNLDRLKTRTVELAQKIFEDQKYGLNSAIHEIKRLKKRKGLALCFVAPAIDKGKFPALKAHLHNWVMEVRKDSRWDALVWIEQIPPLGTTTVHPGLLLIIKEVD